MGSQAAADVGRICDALENIASILEQIRVEIKKKRYDDAEWRNEWSGGAQ